MTRLWLVVLVLLIAAAMAWKPEVWGGMPWETTPAKEPDLKNFTIR